MLVNRSSSFQGEKDTELFLGNFDEVTHSYTAQYCESADGTLLPATTSSVCKRLTAFLALASLKRSIDYRRRSGTCPSLV